MSGLALPALKIGDQIVITEGRVLQNVTADAGIITSGTFSTARIPSLSAGKITSGTFPIARGGTGLSALGSAGQVLRVNDAGDALEYGDGGAASVGWDDIIDPPTTRNGYGLTDVYTRSETDAAIAAGGGGGGGIAAAFARIADADGADQFVATGADALRIEAGDGMAVAFDAGTKKITLSADPDPIAWGDIADTPTTLAGYGITDALSQAGGEVGGSLTFGAAYGHGVVGLYNQARVRQVYAMGAAYTMPADGQSTTGFYGLAYGYQGVQGFPANIGHAVGVDTDGAIKSAIGSDIWTAGNAYATAFFTSSSRELKTQIRAYADDALSIVRDTRIVEFSYRSDEAKARRIGFIAEDTAPVLSGSDQRHMDVTNAIGVLLRAVQQLDEKVSHALS